MAGDWIPISNDLPDEVEVLQIARALGIEPETVCGHLLRVWGWLDRHVSVSRDERDICHAAGVTKVQFDRIAQRDGFADAMASAGWLKVTTTGVEFPNVQRWLMQSSKARLLATRRQEKHRRKMSRAERDSSVTSSVTNRTVQENKNTPCKSPAGGRSNSLDTRPHLEIFNRLARAQGLPSIRMIGSARARKLKARIDETGAKDAGGFWAPIAKAVSERSTWAREQSFLTFDWLMSPTNLAKLLEGNYKGKASGRSTGGSDVAKFGEEGAT
jgi:hypothetical protein